jgi:protein transport protein SEC23
MKDDVILLLDTFFYVCIWKGKNVLEWEKEGYGEKEGFEHIKALLESPIEDANYIMAERFPMPRFFITFPGDTNERRLKARVNPSSLTN